MYVYVGVGAGMTTDKDLGSYRVCRRIGLVGQSSVRHETLWLMLFAFTDVAVSD